MFLLSLFFQNLIHFLGGIFGVVKKSISYVHDQVPHIRMTWASAYPCKWIPHSLGIGEVFTSYRSTKLGESSTYHWYCTSWRTAFFG